MTGFRLYWPELPRLTTDLQASKSSTTSATLSAATSMSTFSLMPDCCPLGVVSAVSAPPVGTTELASGLLRGVGREHQAHLRVLAGGQRGLAELLEHAVRQAQQIDALGGTQHHFGPAAVGVDRARALVHAHSVDRHVDRVVAARRRIGQRQVHRAVGLPVPPMPPPPPPQLASSRCARRDGDRRHESDVHVESLSGSGWLEAFLEVVDAHADARAWRSRCSRGLSMSCAASQRSSFSSKA